MQQHTVLKWTGRVTGILVMAFFAAFFIGEALPDILKGKGKDLLFFLPVTLPALAGYILSWFNTLWGGRLLIAGGMIMGIYFFLHGDYLMSLVYGLPAVLVGLCFIAAANKELI